jgi:hypothetical protein
MGDDAGLGIEALDALLDRTRQALAATGSLAAGSLESSSLESSSLESTSAEGQGADGLIRATVGPNRLVSLHIDPEAARLSTSDLAEEITAAVNAGFEELRRQAGTAEALRDAQSLATGLSAELKDLQNDSMRSMAMIGQTLADALAQLRETR